MTRRMRTHSITALLLIAIAAAMTLSACASEPAPEPMATPDIPATVNAAVAQALVTSVATPVGVRHGYCGRLCDAGFWMKADLSKVQAQLDNGADVNATDADGWAPLHLAAIHDHADIVALLLEHGANINAKTKLGNTPLHLPAIHNSEMSWVLFYHGADIMAKDNGGNTILHYAALSDNPGHIKRLIVNGADIDALNGYGLTPCQRLLAFHNSHCFTPEFVKLPYCQAGISVKWDIRRLLCR